LVDALPDTSTIRALPSASIWVNLSDMAILVQTAILPRAQREDYPEKDTA
jgi:hypothetical protein